MLAIRLEREPDAWTSINTQSMLGGALECQQKHAEAEPLLLAGYEGLKARENQIPLRAKVRLTDALRRLVQLYESWDKPEEAAKWRGALELQIKQSDARSQ